ncbi:MAG: Fic family protein [Planctomycetota bacterium]
MDIGQFTAGSPGQLVPIELHRSVRKPSGLTEIEPFASQAFSPDVLPPALDWRSLAADLLPRVSLAQEALGRVNGLTTVVHNARALLRSLWLREAKFSSAIEDVHTTALDMALVATQAERPESNRAVEAWNAVNAIEHGLASDLPFSVRLIKEMHVELLRGVRGEDKRPGELRTIPVYIGPQDRPDRARFVPPPPGNAPGHLVPLLADLERFVNQTPEEVFPLAAVAIAHYQFETIHPFRDGNGRIGRALVIHDLCRRGLLDQHVVFLSGYFERNKQMYYDRLLGVSARGDWADWIAFFLDAIVDQAGETARLAEKLFRLRERYIDTVRTKNLSARLLTLIDALFHWPVVTARGVAETTGVTDPTARKDIGVLVDHGILKLTSEVSYGQTWYAVDIIRLIEGDADQDL